MLLPVHELFGGAVIVAAIELLPQFDVQPFATVTVTGADVVVLPAASPATAFIVWVPSAAVVLSHVIEYGAVVSSMPRFAPSSLNCTPATPTLSAAVALTATVAPETVAPPAGAVIDTVGAVVSPVLDTVTVTAADVFVLPAASRATAVNVCVPFVAVVVSHGTKYGAAVASVPRFAPSSLNCTPAPPTL